MTEETLFQDVLAQPPEKRAAFLEQACVGRPELRAAVEALLGAHGKSDDPLGKRLSEFAQTKDPGPDTGTSATPGEILFESNESTPSDPQLAATSDFGRDSYAGAVIAGRYVLQEKIGEGGMGEVWVARQTEPVKRKVALKLIKTGMDSRAVQQRFEQERQALALMDHPNIARVLDGGMTPTGQPFFVMELVNGLPLTEFCDEAKLTPTERLELFVPICQAVQHAHHKGIVHRDLKPANILVTRVDARPVPKVIDFGVAKATSGKLTDETMSTRFGAVMGTLEYMSPEQAGFSNVDIDTRADIYSLGVILYELLTGLRPIDAKRLKQAALTEMIRIIREDEPAKPSTRLSTDDSLPTLAAVRQIEPRKLMALLRGELDWVVMKCLEKKRDRRYETADGLAQDIQRYLANEPVEARPPSIGYRLQKFISRNRGKVLAAGLVVLALVVGIVGTTLGLLEAKRQKEVAVQARDSETRRAEAEMRERQRAEKAEAEANMRAKELEQVAEFQSKQFQGIDVPLTGIRLRNDLLEKVKAAAVKANLEPDDVEARVAEVERLVAGADFAGMAIETLKQNVFVPTLEAIDEQFTAQPLVQAQLQQTLAAILRDLGLYDLALAPQQAALATRRNMLGENHPDTLESMKSMSSQLRLQGKHDAAEVLLVKALDEFRNVCGNDDPRTLHCLNMLAVLRGSQGRWKEEAKLHAQALEGFRRVLGEEHKETLDAMSGLGSALMSSGDFDEAEKILLEAYQTLKRVNGADDRATLVAANNLGIVLRDQKKYEEAEEICRLVMDKRRATLGANHRSTVVATISLADLLDQMDRTDESLRLLVNNVEDARSAYAGSQHKQLGVYLSRLGDGYARAGKFKESESALNEAHQLLVDGFGAAGGHAILCVDRQIELFRKWHRADAGKGYNATADKLIEEALKTAERQLAEVRKKGPPGSPALASSLAKAGARMLKFQRFEEAEPILRECQAIREKTQPDEWQTYNTNSMLGGALLGLEKYAEAEPLLLKGYLGMKKCEKSIPPQANTLLREALERLIQLYTETNRPDEVTKWQAEKDMLTD